MSFVINSKVPVASTPEIVFLKGGVSLAAYSIPFFTTNVPLEFAANYFKLFEELPQADTGEWTLEELFQRDISWERVDKEILAYLKSTTRPQFFNALTVALLPAHADSFGGEFGADVDLPPIPGDGLGAPLRVGGIHIQFYGSDVDQVQGAGKMKWSTGNVDAVAVDGQHRLAAIKRFVKEAKRESWDDASIPVIFLVADERIGFQTPKGADEKPRSVSALRSVFIDLNKNAKPVSPTRNILLDDLEITSVCTRSVIGRSLGETVDDSRVPLALVDWMTDRNKIDDGPFVTTVMLLQEAVSRLIEVPDLLMDEDDNSVGRVEKWLNETLPIADGEALAEVLAQVSACARLQTRLSWLPAHIRTLQGAFDAKWRPHVRRLFRDYKPYSDVWTYMDEKGLLGPQFINLYVAKEIMPTVAGQERANRLVEAAKQSANGAWTLDKNYSSPLAEVAGLKEGSWAYKVVYQRGLMRTMAAVLRDKTAYFTDVVSDEEAMTRLLAALNALEAAGFGKVEAKLGSGKDLFWQGAGLTADATIEFTNAGAERLRSWLEVFLILRDLGAASPHFNSLADSAAKPRRTLARLLGDRAPLAKGMQKLSVARGNDPEDEAIPAKYLKARYDALRAQAII